MNKCPNCGAIANAGETCMLCGTVIPNDAPAVEEVKEEPIKIDVIPLQYEDSVQSSVMPVEQPVATEQPVMPVEQPVTTEPVTESTNEQPNQTVEVPVTTNTQQIQNNNVTEIEIKNRSNGVNDDVLIDSYIKSHTKKLKSGGFSFCTLLLNAIYILYRKMYLLGFFIMAIDAAIITCILLNDLPYYLTYGLYAVLQFF